MNQYRTVIYFLVTESEDAKMDIREIRRRNLGKLMEREFGNVRGAQSRMAERLGQQQSFISRCLAAPDSSGAKTIGEDLARSIEKEFRLPRYALDKEPFVTAPPPPAAIDSTVTAADFTGSPRSRAILHSLTTAAAEGRLSDQDLELLDAIAQRLAHTGSVKNAPVNQGHQKLRSKLQHDPVPDP